MERISRRGFIKAAGSTALVGMLGAPYLAMGAAKKVVVVGGGPGGATAAKYLRRLDPGIEVTLIEPKKEYYTCFFSNEVIGGERKLETLRFTYDGLKKHGVQVVHDTVTGIDGGAKTVMTAGGQKFAFDRCIVAPGIDFKWGAIEGYDEKASETLPHAWKAGEQTMLLRRQLESMAEGGTVIIVAPPSPYRCPPGPYERASLIAHYLKTHKPKSKILILDPKDGFSKQPLFEAGWKKHYPGMIEWVSGQKGGKAESIDVAARVVRTEMDQFKGDVINVIPPQMAGRIALSSGLADDKGWCPNNPATFESTLVPNVHVIGDASIAGAIPKSAYAANSQAKVCAMAVAALLNGKQPPTPAYFNTCYSMIAPDHAVTIVGVYRLQDGKIAEVPGSGGITPVDAPDEMLRREMVYAYSWFNNITDDIFG